MQENGALVARSVRSKVKGENRPRGQDEEGGTRPQLIQQLENTFSLLFLPDTVERGRGR